MKFRICTNEHGFYKIQLLKPSITIFGITIKKTEMG